MSSENRPFPEKKKAYTTTTEKKIFWRTSLVSKKNFPGRWWIQKPYKNQRKPYPPPKSFLCGPHFFLQRKVLHWSRAVYAFFFTAFCLPCQWAFETYCKKRKRSNGMATISSQSVDGTALSGYKWVIYLVLLKGQPQLHNPRPTKH